MAGRRASGTHYHAHIEDVPLSVARAERDSYAASLDSPDDVIEWLAEQLRTATGKDDMVLDDEMAVWGPEIRQGQQISTGLRDGPTFTVTPMPDGVCWCRGSLQPV